ncbi:MAG: hypothetical protein IJ452_04915 [Butyricicoccus sp.]|nr:hypothetical protein [Butyricicoccus sp.]MBQ8585609.1 hypothetical protein [Butyricicoccus sp.]
MAEYTGLSFVEVGQLNYLEYLTYRRDALIYTLSRTDAGEEYLNNAWRMEQTKPDRAALREKFGKEGANGGEHD